MAIDEQKLMEEVIEEVDNLDEAELAEEAEKILARKAKQAEYRRNQEKSPEQVEAQKAYRKKKYQRDKLILDRYNALTEPEGEYSEPDEE